MLASRLGWDFPCRHERGFCSIDAVFRDLDQRAAQRLARTAGIKGVYAYEDGAATSFEARVSPKLKSLLARAILSASNGGKMPICPPSSSITRISRARMRSLVRIKRLSIQSSVL